MELWKWELRKIWRPGILAAILLLGAVYYWMFPQFYIEYFCNGPSGEAQFDLASDWVARYGPTLEPEERAQLDGQLAEEIGFSVKTLNRSIQHLEEMGLIQVRKGKVVIPREGFYQMKTHVEHHVNG